MICQDLIKLKGAGSKYVKDCQIRAIQGKPYLEAVRLVGWDKPPPIVIHAGIGILVLSPDGEEFTAAPTLGQMAKSYAASFLDRTLASQEEIERRLAICQTCPYWEKDRCTVCGCGTKTKTALRGQACPKGFW